MNYRKLIDHTLLKADASLDAILKLCDEAKDFGFCSVCVNPGFIKDCAARLAGSDVKVCTVIGFPLGATSTAAKAYEAKVAVEDGADELDMVINISRLKDKDDEYVYNDVKAVVDAANGKIVKVIIETCLLTNEEKVRACELCVKAGAHFVKTSTGFSTAGATPEDVKLMKDTVGDRALVKAAGGVRSYEDLLKMVEAGASRIGTSGGPKLFAGEKVTGY